MKKYENIQKNSQTSEWNAKTTTTILDNKSLERTVASLDAEIDKLRKELKDQRDKTSSAQKETREQMRGEVDKTTVTRDLQNQIDELKRSIESEREKFQEELLKSKEDFEKQINSEKKEKRRITTQALKTKDIKGSGVKAFDSFARSFDKADVQDMGMELKEVRQKLEQEEDKNEKMKKKI